MWEIGPYGWRLFALPIPPILALVSTALIVLSWQHLS